MIGSVLWFTRTGQGDGTFNSPYHSSPDAEALCPTPTVVSLQDDGQLTRINISWQGVDDYQWYDGGTMFIGTVDTQSGTTPNSNSSVDMLEFTALPQAGQKWELVMSITNSKQVDAQSINCTYDTLYLRF